MSRYRYAHPRDTRPLQGRIDDDPAIGKEAQAQQEAYVKTIMRQILDLESDNVICSYAILRQPSAVASLLSASTRAPGI